MSQKKLWYVEIVKKSDLTQPATKADIEDAVGQLGGAVINALKNVATKEDLKQFATKEDLKQFATKEGLKQVEQKVDHLQSDVTDVRRRMIDLEHDTPSQAYFNHLKKRVDQLEPAN